MWPCAVPAQNAVSQELGLKLPVPRTQKVRVAPNIHTLVRCVLPLGQPCRAICGTRAGAAGRVMAAVRCAVGALTPAFAAAIGRAKPTEAAMPTAAAARRVSLRMRYSFHRAVMTAPDRCRTHPQLLSSARPTDNSIF